MSGGGGRRRGCDPAGCPPLPCSLSSRRESASRSRPITVVILVAITRALRGHARFRKRARNQRRARCDRAAPNGGRGRCTHSFARTRSHGNVRTRPVDCRRALNRDHARRSRLRPGQVVAAVMIVLAAASRSRP
ncbi:unnamed protein product, partial [Iphiclides podalirius]